MKKHSSLATLLTQYSSIAGVVLSASTAHSQIIYTDVNPDIIIGDTGSESYVLDLNNDQNDEFILAASQGGIDPSGSNGQIFFNLYMSNVFDYDHSQFLAYSGIVKKINYGNVIGGSANGWEPVGQFAYNENPGVSNYAWNGVEKYIGVRFKLNGDYRYGWIRVSVSADNPNNLSITLKDYAYNSDPNAPIHAGEGPASPVCQSYEPNNNFSHAEQIGNNGEIFSLIQQSGDLDFYRFNVSDDEPNLRVTLFGMPKNYDLVLFDGDHNKIAKSKNLQKENDTIVYNAEQGGTYFVKVYQKDGKFDETNCYGLKVETSTNPFKISADQNIADEMSLKIFPNPANQFLSIQFNEELFNDVVLNIFDLQGREMMSTVLPVDASTFQLDISSLTSGMYLLKTVAGNQVMMKKFSVVK